MARSPKAPSRLTVGIPQPERWGGAELTHSKSAKSRVWGVWMWDDIDIFHEIKGTIAQKSEISRAALTHSKFAKSRVWGL